MSETKHTPGPWYEAKMGNDHQGLVVDEKTGANIAVIYDKANARLIAAAPELLEACAEGLHALEQHGDDFHPIIQSHLRAALEGLD